MSFINAVVRMIRRSLSLGPKGFRPHGRSSRARNGSRPQQWRPWLEELEPRLVPSWSEPFISPSGVLALIGSGMNNTATLDSTTNVEFPYTRIIASGLGERDFVTSTFTSIQVSEGDGGDTIVVLALDRPAAIIGGGGHDAVFVGHSGDLRYLHQSLTVTNPPGFTALTVDDSMDSLSHQATLSESGLTNLAPAPITYQQNDLSSLDVHLSNPSGGNNSLTVTNTPSNTINLTTTITTGKNSNGANDVLVEATTGPLTVNLNSIGFEDTHPITQVLLGYGGSGTLDNIHAALTVNTLTGLTDMGLDDQATAVGQGYIVTGSTITRSGQLIATYQITYVLSMYTSSGDNNTIDVQSTSTVATILYAGVSNDHITVKGLPPSGTYTAIQLYHPGSHVIIDDHADMDSTMYTCRRGITSPANEILSTTSGVESGTIDIEGPLQDLVFTGGSPSNMLEHDTYNIETLDYNTTINAGVGSHNNTFLVSPVAQKLENILGALTIHGAGNDTLIFYDINNTNNEEYTFSPDVVPSHLTLASDPNFDVTWTGMASVHLWTNDHSMVDDPSQTVFVNQ